MKKHVDGKDKAKIMLYALSTCVWCKKTKNLLNDLGLAYDFEDVDLLDEKDQGRAVKEIEKWNSSGGFPLIVVNNERCIKGFNEEEIRKTLG
ncbi:MAG: glutaredoxin family protein [Candidatus Margulisiibacteriota bacterium]